MGVNFWVTKLSNTLYITTLQKVLFFEGHTFGDVQGVRLFPYRIRDVNSTNTSMVAPTFGLQLDDRERVRCNQLRRVRQHYDEEHGKWPLQELHHDRFVFFGNHHAAPFFRFQLEGFLDEIAKKLHAAIHLVRLIIHCYLKLNYLFKT